MDYYWENRKRGLVLITTGQATEDATQRFLGHVERFQQLADMAQRREFISWDQALLEEERKLDNLFPNSDYRFFGRR